MPPWWGEEGWERQGPCRVLSQPTAPHDRLSPSDSLIQHMIIEHPECTVPRQLQRKKKGLSLPGRQTRKPTVIQQCAVETGQCGLGASGQASQRKGHLSWGLKHREEFARLHGEKVLQHAVETA